MGRRRRRRKRGRGTLGDPVIRVMFGAVAIAAVAGEVRHSSGVVTSTMAPWTMPAWQWIGIGVLLVLAANALIGLGGKWGPYALPLLLLAGLIAWAVLQAAGGAL